MASKMNPWICIYCISLLKMVTAKPWKMVICKRAIPASKFLKQLNQPNAHILKKLDGDAGAPLAVREGLRRCRCHCRTDWLQQMIH